MPIVFIKSSNKMIGFACDSRKFSNNIFNINSFNTTLLTKYRYFFGYLNLSLISQISKNSITSTESEFNEFKPRLKSAKNRFQLSARLNFATLNTILSGTNHN